MPNLLTISFAGHWPHSHRDLMNAWTNWAKADCNAFLVLVDVVCSCCHQKNNFTTTNPVDKLGPYIFYDSEGWKCVCDCFFNWFGERILILSIHLLTRCHWQCSMRNYESINIMALAPQQTSVVYRALKCISFLSSLMQGLMFSSRAALSCVAAWTFDTRPPHWQEFRSSLYIFLNIFYSEFLHMFRLPSCQSYRHIHSLRISANTSPR